MKNLKEFNIQFVGLKLGVHQFDYHIEKSFFEAFHYDEFDDVNITVSIALDKKSTLLELNFAAKGTVTIPCDITNELFEQDINGNFPLIIKFGPEFNDDSEEVLILPHEEYQVNVAQYIYELIVLSVPSKRIHPKVKDGTMEHTALKKLNELAYNKEESVESNTTTDPRWDKLKDLLTGKNS